MRETKDYLGRRRAKLILNTTACGRPPEGRRAVRRHTGVPRRAAKLVKLKSVVESGINQPESHELSKNSAARQVSGCVYANSTPSAGAPNSFTHGCVLCREVDPSTSRVPRTAAAKCGERTRRIAATCLRSIEPQSFTRGISKCGSSRQASRCGILALKVAARQGEMLSLRYCSAIHIAGSEAGPGPVGALLWGLRLLRRGHSHGGLPCLRRKSIPRAPGRVVSDLQPRPPCPVHHASGGILAFLLIASLSGAGVAGAQPQGDPDFLFERPRGSVGIRGGWLFERAGSDLFTFVQEQLTVEPNAFDARRSRSTLASPLRRESRRSSVSSSAAGPFAPSTGTSSTTIGCRLRRRPPPQANLSASLKLALTPRGGAGGMIRN